MTYSALRTNNRLYLGNKMSGVSYFNAPWFDATAAELLAFGTVLEVFNPAQHDRDTGFDPMCCPGGTPAEARAAGFDVARALRDDWTWISRRSDGLVIGPDWWRSPGTISEIACHQALRLPVWELDAFRASWACPDLYDRTLKPILELNWETAMSKGMT